MKATICLCDCDEPHRQAIYNVASVSWDAYGLLIQYEDVPGQVTTVAFNTEEVDWLRVEVEPSS